MLTFKKLRRPLHTSIYMWLCISIASCSNVVKNGTVHNWGVSDPSRTNIPLFLGNYSCNSNDVAKPSPVTFLKAGGICMEGHQKWLGHMAMPLNILKSFSTFYHKLMMVEMMVVQYEVDWFKSLGGVCWNGKCGNWRSNLAWPFLICSSNFMKISVC